MLIKVKVFAKNKIDEVVQKSEDGFEVKTKTRPERGEANKRVGELLAGFLKISSKNIKLIKGGQQRAKIFKIIKDNNQTSRTPRPSGTPLREGN